MNYLNIYHIKIIILIYVVEHPSGTDQGTRGHYQAYSYLPRKTNSRGMRGPRGAGAGTMQPTARSQPLPAFAFVCSCKRIGFDFECCQLDTWFQSFIINSTR